MNDRLSILALDFLMLSLLSVGGAATLLPEMHRNLVEVHGWMRSEQFAQLYALAQAAPGPNVLVVSALGWQVAGVAGAIVSTLCMIVPSCILMFCADRFLASSRGQSLREILDNGLAPIAAGLLGSAGVLLARTADINTIALILTIAAALISWRTRLHPLWMIALGATLGAVGWV